MLALYAPPAFAQTQAQPSAPAAAKLSKQQLDSLTAPIALYPDALLAQVLMATTYPSEVTAAAAWSSSHTNVKGDDAVKAVASEPWDPSVQSLVAFPQVLATMNSKPDWVSQLGNAFLAQPNDVMDSVQRLRKQAQQAGNLKTNEQQKVIVEQSTIQIVPANPQVVYVPTYNPTVVYGAWAYPAYPPVYIPPPVGYYAGSALVAGLAFGTGIAITNALWGGFNWNSHDVNVNVNRYNNINVNNRLNANNTTANWNRNDPQFNRNVDRSNRQNNINTGNIGSGNRAQADQFRGREDPRAQARQTLETRTGQDVTGSASQRVQDIKQGGERGNRGGGAGGAGSANRNDLQQRAQGVNRDNALRGAGDGDAARRDMQRGQGSRDQLANRGGGGGNLGAGGGGREFGGGGGGGGREFGGGGGGGGGMRGGGGGFGGGHGGGMRRR
ncbi:DUF3300 domain-containing protein [Caballeronia humi]|nr:DUF3300 domain-containing protein [Caballeronia humi]